MKLVIFGLAVSSSWGNGHATLWRGLCDALAARGHRVVFYERDRPFYATARDLWSLTGGGELVIYGDFTEIAARACHDLCDADVGVVTSFCPDGVAAMLALLDAPHALRVYYDLDTPVTLERMARGEAVDDLDPALLPELDLVLSYTGGAALAALRGLGARRVEVLHGWVDPEIHRPAVPQDQYRGALSYLGTYAADRQRAVAELFLAPAARRPEQRFVLAGAGYPDGFPWSANLFFVRHLPPAEHAAFFASCPLTLNVTRAAMAAGGFCPSGRLFEAAACATAVVSVVWPGIETFFEPGREILLADTAEDVLAALDLPGDVLAAIGTRARERVLAEHTATRRAERLERLLGSVGPARAPAAAALATG